MEYNFLLVVVNSFLLVGAGVIFILPLRKREKWLFWLPVILILCVLVIDQGYRSDGKMIFVYHTITYILLFLMVNRCTTLPVADDCYCAIWIFITAEAVQELWLGARIIFADVQIMDVKSSLELLVFAAVLYLILGRTVTRWLPKGDIYQVGAGQLFCAVLLGGMFVALSYYFNLPGRRSPEVTSIIILCQICCVSMLFFVTESSKKRQAEKKLDMMNLLCGFGAQQYAVAYQNISVVNQKCEELEEMIQRMQQFLPEEFQREARGSIQDALRCCDTVVKSGNEVLDIVLTEKNLLAETSGIQLSCVADGKLLEFMELVDIYALFSYMLENAIEEVAGIPDETHRLIDVLVHRSQNFLVINISNPMRERTIREGIRATKNRNNLTAYKIMVMHRIVEKYHGMHSIEKGDGFFTLKILIPLAQNRK